MKKAHYKKVPLFCFIWVSITLINFCVINESYAREFKHEKIMELKEPLTTGGSFEAETHNGSITIRGEDVSTCNVKATIIARAKTKEKAQEIAEKVIIELEPSDNKIVTRVEKPKAVWTQSYNISVNLDVTVPNEVNLELTTHNGPIEIENINGEINNKTHNGSIKTTRVSGTIKLKTHNGSITCNEISGKTELRTHNGKVNASYSKTAVPICDISMITHNGGIKFIAPPEFSATVDISSHNGSIESDLPILIKGKISGNNIEGTIGKGEGKLYLRTHNGAIKIE
jgi:hypothetical protein